MADNNDNNIFSRLRNAANVFFNRNIALENRNDKGMSSTIPGHRTRLKYGNEKSMVSSIYTRIALDVSSIKVLHVRVNDDDAYVAPIDSGLNNCLSVEANVDQTSRALIQDVVMSMFDEGVVAIVPVDTSVSLVEAGSFDVLTLRTGKIVEWYPKHVRILLYNDNTGIKEEITLPKSKVAIIENPLYSVMNEPNSTLKRLIRKLNLLDAIDDQSGSGKLDLIIQLPYVVKTEARRKLAEQRREDLEQQLTGSKYGIAYADGTEKVIQLNRPAENNLMSQIEFLTRMLYSQLGLSESIFDGSADEKTLLNYHIRTVEPVIASIADEIKRKFLSKTSRTQKQSIKYFRNTFGLVTASTLGELADKLTRNEVVTSNEFRSVLGLRPSTDKGADELRNKNLNNPNTDVQPDTDSQPIPVDMSPVKTKEGVR